MNPNANPATTPTNPGLLRTTWDHAAQSFQAAVNHLRERYATPAPTLSLPGYEPTADVGAVNAQVYRVKERPEDLLALNESASCGPGPHAVPQPWNNLIANYHKPAEFPAASLEGLSRTLQSQGTPLRPGDVVAFKGLHVFEPQKYAQAVSAPSTPALWHNLGTPLMVAGGVLVSIAAVKFLTQEERPKTTVEIEHGR